MAASSTNSMTTNDKDFDSPGFEYLRSYQNAFNLYYKLLALNYQNEFCSLYKCPTIHKYYFTTPSKNQGEQQFSFFCLCAWLIKHKCQMNLQLEPEEYEDPELTIETILEALRLLHGASKGNESIQRANFNQWLRFPVSRLRDSYGPEIVWVLNVLADRALDIDPINRELTNKKIRVIYSHRSTNNKKQTSITIGQPIVGGGLTTRPLGTYKIDDESLILTGGSWQANDQLTNDKLNIKLNSVPQALIEQSALEWLRNVESAISYLDTANWEINTTIERSQDWSKFKLAIKCYEENIEQFLKENKRPLDMIKGRILRELQLINAKEQYIQSNTNEDIKNFFSVWRDYSSLRSNNENLQDEVNLKMEQFEFINEKLREIRSQTEARFRDLADGRHLRELELKISKLVEDKREFDVKTGMLMSVYASRQCQLLEAGKVE